MMEILDWLSKNSELVVAITATLAVLMSAISIYLTFRTLKDQRSHNQMSIRPIANIAISDYEDNVSVKIENNGTGPLLIKSFSATNGNEVKSNLIDLMPRLPNGIYWQTFFKQLDGFAILPEKAINILEFVPERDDPMHGQCRDDIRRALSKITIRLEYSDIYGKSLPHKERSLEWFGRHFS